LVAIKRAVVIFLVDVVFRMGTALKCVCIGCRKHLWYEWRAYRQIQPKLGLQHETVNHSVNFVDPSTGVHTQSIESYWAKTKYKFKVMKGVRSDALPSYLDERMAASLFASLHVRNCRFGGCVGDPEDPCFFVWSSASLVFRFVVK
jgi:hypothetical protein